jgi:hypothetical protein
VRERGAGRYGRDILQEQGVRQGAERSPELRRL